MLPLSEWSARHRAVAKSAAKGSVPRRALQGKDRVTRPATPDQRAGLSGNPVPSRQANRLKITAIVKMSIRLW